MAYLSAFLALVKMMPDLISAFNKVVKMFQEYSDLQERKEAMKRFNDAVAVSLKDKDTKTLEDMMHGLNPNKPKP